jgi:hypothetical protein
MARVSDGTRDFDSIRPDETDLFQFDFSHETGTEDAIASTNWSCVVSTNSLNTDPSPNHIIGAPVFTDTISMSTVGNLLNGVIYTLTATVTTNQSRILVKSADVSCAFNVDVSTSILTAQQFRVEFPTFATGRYTNEQINFWINQAVNGLNGPIIDPIRWGQFYDLGIRLWVAHNLTIFADIERRERIGSGGMATGLISSRSVGPGSVGYDVRAGFEDNGGNYNLTIYGQQFLRYLRMAGAGPIQLPQTIGNYEVGAFGYWWFGI